MPRKSQGRVTGRPVTATIPNPAGGVKLETFIPWTLVKRGAKKQVITPIEAPEAFRVEAVRERTNRKAAKDTPLVRALGLAHYWQHLLDTGKFESLTEIAAAEGMDLGQVSRIARLALMEPGVVEAGLVGEENRLNLEKLIRNEVAAGSASQARAVCGKTVRTVWRGRPG
jgi:hypothetical protein